MHFLFAATLLLAGISASALTPGKFRGTPTLVIFWRSHCAPCVREMEVLPAIAIAHPKLPIELVSLDAHSNTPSFSLPKNVQWIAATDNPEHTLQTFGDIRLILPFSVFLHKDSSACDTHYGILGTKTVDEWVTQC